MKTKNCESLLISPVSNGVIVTNHDPSKQMLISISDRHVFNKMEDLTKFLKNHFESEKK